MIRSLVQSLWWVYKTWLTCSTRLQAIPRHPWTEAVHRDWFSTWKASSVCSKKSNKPTQIIPQYNTISVNVCWSSLTISPIWLITVFYTEFFVRHSRWTSGRLDLSRKKTTKSFLLVFRNRAVHHKKKKKKLYHCHCFLNRALFVSC